MRTFFKQIFCWHDWQMKHEPYVLELKCKKCSAERVILCV